MPEEEQKKEEQSETLPRLRTMKYDADRYLKDKNVSFLDLVADEQKRKDRKEFVYNEWVSEKAWFRAVMGLLILVFGALAVYAGYVFFATRGGSLPPAGNEPPRAFISAENREIITVRAGDRAGLLAKLEAAQRDALPQGSIKYVVIQFERFGGSPHFATAEEFFTTLDFKPPPGFVFSLTNAINVLIYYRADGASLALVLEPRDYEGATGAMRAWEQTMILDFKTLYFGTQVSPTSRLFEDGVVQNVDMRVLTLPDAPALSYAIFARRLLVISLAPDVMNVIINRLLVSPPIQ